MRIDGGATDEVHDQDQIPTRPGRVQAREEMTSCTSRTMTVNSDKDTVISFGRNRLPGFRRPEGAKQVSPGQRPGEGEVVTPVASHGAFTAYRAGGSSNKPA